MALHCAGACCAKERSKVHSRMNKKQVPLYGQCVLPLVRDAALMASSQCAAVAYVHVPQRSRRQKPDGMVRLQRIDGHVHSTHRLELPMDGCSGPLYMAASPCGKALAYVVATLAAFEQPDGGASEPLSQLRVWFPETGHLRTISSEAVRFHFGARWPWYGSTISPQHVAWRHDPNGLRHKLVVSWGDTFVHPCGHGHGQKMIDVDDFYALVEYEFESSGVESTEVEGPFRGRLVSIALDHVGARATALVRRCGTNRSSAPQQCAVVHLLGTERSFDIDHGRVWCSSGELSSEPLAGPLAVGISPMGDTIVCVHRTRSSVLFETFRCVRDELFESVGPIKDVTNYLARFSGPLWMHIPEIPDEDENLIKLPYSVSFSPCGRYCLVCDQRPLFGRAVENHPCVAFDLNSRETTSRSGETLRPLPLDSLAEAAPRTVLWTEIGMWVLSAFGAVLLQK